MRLRHPKRFTIKPGMWYIIAGSVLASTCLHCKPCCLNSIWFVALRVMKKISLHFTQVNVLGCVACIAYDAGYCYKWSNVIGLYVSVCLCVCLRVTFVSRAKTTEPRLGAVLCRPNKPCIGWGRDPPMGRHNLRGLSSRCESIGSLFRSFRSKIYHSVVNNRLQKQGSFNPQ